MNKFVVVNFGTEEIKFFEDFQKVENHIVEYIEETDLYNEVDEVIEDFEIYSLPDGERYYPEVSVSKTIYIK